MNSITYRNDTHADVLALGGGLLHPPVPEAVESLPRPFDDEDGDGLRVRMSSFSVRQDLHPANNGARCNSELCSMT